MTDDWRRPIPRTALVVTHPDTGEVLLRRPKSDFGKPMTTAQYRAVEAERAIWAKAQLIKDQEEEEIRKAEIRELRSRKMGRDSLEETAHQVYKRLSTWHLFVDTERWTELLAWLDAHPQRVSEDDEQLIGLDGRIRNLEGIPISLIEFTSRHRGRPKGTEHSSESNRKRSEAMKKQWEAWKAGGRRPAVGRPPRSRSQNDEAPY
jgi:hypothetical protein